MLIFATEQSGKTDKRLKKKKSLEGSVQKIGSFGVKDRMFYGKRSDLLSALFRVCRKMVELKRLIYQLPCWVKRMLYLCRRRKVFSQR